jgi:acetolactate synthase small subunit
MQQLISLGWRHEANADFTVVDATDEDAKAVYRVYNNNNGGIHFYTDDELFINETALFKLSTPVMLKNHEVSSLVRSHDARIIEVNSTYAVVEITGNTNDIIDLFNELKKLDCVLQFVRSGRICITKSRTEHLDEYLAVREAKRIAQQKK